MTNITSIFRRLLFLTIFLSLIPLFSNAEDVNDPFESANRKIFDFNNILDDNIFVPIAKGWRKVPDIPRKPLSNLSTLAQTPISLANAILQLNRESIGNILGRFLINMTFGLGGMFDVAGTKEFGNVPAITEDFGQTLATWGVPDGPYVMLPIFGPSSVRDAFGMGVDTITNPLSFAYRMNGIGIEARLSGPVLRGVNQREKYLDYVEEMKASSLDFYATMRSLYRQKRKKDISGLLEDENASSLDFIPVASIADDDGISQASSLSFSDELDSTDLDSSFTDISGTEDKEVNQQVKKIVQAQVKRNSKLNSPILMPSSNYPGAKTVESRYAPRIYNGIMPSSNYPEFSKSRVNLIN